MACLWAIIISPQEVFSQSSMEEFFQPPKVYMFPLAVPL